MLSEGGGPPPEPATMELLCGGNARPQGYTDSKGRFSFQLGQNADVMADASYSPGFGGPGAGPMTQNPNANVRPRDLNGCELRASLAGFRSDSVSLATRRSLDDPDVGTIILHRMANVEGLTVSATSAMSGRRTLERRLRKAASRKRRARSTKRRKTSRRPSTAIPNTPPPGMSSATSTNNAMRWTPPAKLTRSP